MKENEIQSRIYQERDYHQKMEKKMQQQQYVQFLKGQQNYKQRSKLEVPRKVGEQIHPH